MPPKKSKKLTQNSEAVQLLRLKFKIGDITDQSDPKSVWEKEEIFKEHKLNNFRTCFNNVKKEFVNATVDHSDDDGLNRTLTGALSSKKRRGSASTVQIDVDESEDEDIETGACSEPTNGEKFFKPLYLLSTWKEPGSMTKRITAAVILPSGVDSGEFSISVSPGGMTLDITVMWPAPLVDLQMMHRKWLGSQSAGDFRVFHPKYTGFEDALKKVRDRISDNLESVARIPLPFAVQTHIDQKYNLAWRECSAKMVYVEMKAFVEQYAVVNDEADFEVL